MEQPKARGFEKLIFWRAKQIKKYIIPLCFRLYVYQIYKLISNKYFELGT